MTPNTSGRTSAAVATLPATMCCRDSGPSQLFLASRHIGFPLPQFKPPCSHGFVQLLLSRVQLPLSLDQDLLPLFERFLMLATVCEVRGRVRHERHVVMARVLSRHSRKPSNYHPISLEVVVRSDYLPPGRLIGAAARCPVW